MGTSTPSDPFLEVLPSYADVAAEPVNRDFSASDSLSPYSLGFTAGNSQFCDRRVCTMCAQVCWNRMRCHEKTLNHLARLRKAQNAPWSEVDHRFSLWRYRLTEDTFRICGRLPETRLIEPWFASLRTCFAVTPRNNAAS